MSLYEHLFNHVVVFFIDNAGNSECKTRKPGRDSIVSEMCRHRGERVTRVKFITGESGERYKLTPYDEPFYHETSQVC